MGLSPESRARFNLERASVLVLDESPMGMSILVQILTGFGVKTLHRCEKVEEAKDVISKVEIDLIVCDALGAGGEGYDFVSWLRSSKIEPNCYAPVLLTAVHPPSNPVARARDGGGHFVIANPVTPASMRLSKDLKKRGWTFVGPTTCYAFMQATGMVNDHLTGCARHAACVKLGRAWS